MEVTNKLTSFYLNMLVTKLEQKRAFKSWSNDPKEYSRIFDEVIENQKKKCLEEKKNELVVSY